jgi:predicted PurR-regulated permease PerM
LRKRPALRGAQFATLAGYDEPRTHTPPPVSDGPSSPADRRGRERRAAGRVADLTLPELRRMVLTSFLFVGVLALFLWMVRSVLIAGILGVVAAAYLRPLDLRLRKRTGGALAAVLILLGILLPVVALLLYGYVEVRGVVEYLVGHQGEVARELEEAVGRLPFVAPEEAGGIVRRGVEALVRYGEELPGKLSEGVAGFAVGLTIFLFTAFYVLTQAGVIVAYVRGKIPARYRTLVRSLEANVRGVLYGAIYSTLLTQAIKSGVILAMNLAFGVPLPIFLALLSFVIGFFPIVGSWSVYLPVAGWLLVFRDRPVAALLMVAVGFFTNTLFFSLYLRPKIAAERSGVLNFYWMFLGLVTGVYTFGIAGILLGPLLIGLLKAVLDTVMERGSWRRPAGGGNVLAP